MSYQIIYFYLTYLYNHLDKLVQPVDLISYNIDVFLVLDVFL